MSLMRFTAPRAIQICINRKEHKDSEAEIGAKEVRGTSENGRLRFAIFAFFGLIWATQTLYCSISLTAKNAKNTARRSRNQESPIRIYRRTQRTPRPFSPRSIECRGAVLLHPRSARQGRSKTAP